MKKGSTTFLKAVVCLIAILVLTFCVFLFPALIHKENRDIFPIILGIYLLGVIFEFALYQAFKLLNYIDQSKAFSDLSIKSLM